jgi:hypothetical protein
MLCRLPAQAVVWRLDSKRSGLRRVRTARAASRAQRGRRSCGLTRPKPCSTAASAARGGPESGTTRDSPPQPPARVTTNQHAHTSTRPHTNQHILPVKTQHARASTLHHPAARIARASNSASTEKAGISARATRQPAPPGAASGTHGRQGTAGPTRQDRARQSKQGCLGPRPAGRGWGAGASGARGAKSLAGRGEGEGGGGFAAVVEARAGVDEDALVEGLPQGRARQQHPRPPRRCLRRTRFRRA